MKAMQEQVRTFATRYGLFRAPEIHLLDLLAEVGELAKEILLASNYGQREPGGSPRLVEELGDVCYAFSALACACQVDLEETLMQVLAKCEARLATRADPGSGR